MQFPYRIRASKAATLFSDREALRERRLVSQTDVSGSPKAVGRVRTRA